MSPNELEDINHDSSSEVIPTYTPSMRQWLIDGFECFPCPDEHDKAEFMARKPAMGATTQILDEIQQHNKRLPPVVQQRKIYRSIRFKMLRQLIPCSGAATMDELLDILRAELDSGIPAPIPDWYTFSKKSLGPRNMGYNACGARGCYQTETAEKDKEPFARCSRCKLIYYCSRDCQKTDWKVRHKQVCKDGSKLRSKTKKAAKVIEMLNQAYTQNR